MNRVFPKAGKMLYLSMRDLRSRKLAVLEEVEIRKEILFAPCSSTITQQVKKQAWEEVLERAIGVRLASVDCDWQYMRDQLYNVWKIRTVAKLAAVRFSGQQVGAATGIRQKLNEVDFKILEIICTSPALEYDPDLDPKPGRSGRREYANAQTARQRAFKRRVTAVMDTYHRKKHALNLRLLQYEIYSPKLNALKREMEAGLRRAYFDALKGRGHQFFNHVIILTYL